MLHPPSLAIGAILASITIIVVIFGMNSSLYEQELLIEPTPKVEQMGPAKITMDTFVLNGSPILGDSNAPITLVEFGDYQCHYCNVFFQSIEEDIIKNYVETGKVKMILKTITLLDLIQLMLHMEHIVQMNKNYSGNIMIFYIQIGQEKITVGHLQVI